MNRRTPLRLLESRAGLRLPRLDGDVSISRLTLARRDGRARLLDRYFDDVRRLQRGELALRRPLAVDHDQHFVSRRKDALSRQLTVPAGIRSASGHHARGPTQLYWRLALLRHAIDRRHEDRVSTRRALALHDLDAPDHLRLDRARILRSGEHAVHEVVRLLH